MKTSTLLLLLGGGALALWLFTRTAGSAPKAPKAGAVARGTTNVWDWLSTLSVAGIGRLGGGSGSNSTPKTIGEQSDGSYDISGSWGGESDASDWSTVEAP